MRGDRGRWGAMQSEGVRGGGDPEQSGAMGGDEGAMGGEGGEEGR